jgi:hypothetical protein
MKIVIRVSSVDYTLCDGAARGVDKLVGPTDIAFTMGALSQTDTIIGASFVSITDRGNRSGTLRFGVTVEKATIDEASYYALWFPAQVKRYGTLRILKEDGTTSNIEWTNAHVAQVDTKQSGVSVDIQFTINVGTTTASL